MTATSVHPPPRPNTEATYRQFSSDDDWAQRIEVAMAVDTEYEPDKHRVFVTRKAAHDRARLRGRARHLVGRLRGRRLATVMGLVEAGGGLARYQSVETHPDLRGRGLAGTLVHRVAAYAFDERGLRTLVMVADPDYLAIRVYRSVGFDDTETQTQLQQKERG